MSRIREDLDGITIVRVGTEDRILRAGDKVPKGATVGDHLLATKKSAAASGDEGTSDATGAASRTDDTSGAGTGDSGAQDAAQLVVPTKVGKGSGTDAWRAYAAAATKRAGLSIDIPEDAKRADIIEALKSAGIATE